MHWACVRVQACHIEVLGPYWSVWGHIVGCFGGRRFGPRAQSKTSGWPTNTACKRPLVAIQPPQGLMAHSW